MVYRTISRRSEGQFYVLGWGVSRPTVLKLAFLGFGCATFCIQPMYHGPGIYNLFSHAHYPVPSFQITGSHKWLMKHPMSSRRSPSSY